MKKMSKYLLSALSVLGSMNLSAFPSQAIGSMPPYGTYELVDARDLEEQLAQQEDVDDFQGDGYVDAKAPLIEPQNILDDKETGDVVENVSDEVVEDDEDKTAKNEKNDFKQESQSDAREKNNENDGDTDFPADEVKNNVGNIKATSEPNDLLPGSPEEIQPKTETSVKVADDKRFVEDNIDVKEKLESTPVVAEIQPETKKEKTLDETKKIVIPSSQPTIQPSEAQNLQKTIKVDEMKNLMSKKVVKSIVDYIPYVVAFAKAKEAYRYLEKERAFDLPHKAYRDLTLLPQFDEVKMFTNLLCDVFDVDVPSEDKMVQNYKNKLPNLVVVNKYLNNILDDVYDCKQAQKNGTYELDLGDLNFVNRLLISATSNDSDDSSTLPDDKSNNRTVSSVNEDEKKVAKKLFGKKIGKTVSADENKDNCAKTVLRKITNNEVKEEVFA